VDVEPSMLVRDIEAALAIRADSGRFLQQLCERAGNISAAVRAGSRGVARPGRGSPPRGAASARGMGVEGVAADGPSPAPWCAARVGAT
jgi:hypothetical protein